MSAMPAAAIDLDPDVIDCLKDVLDPEIGLSIVDMGLVYRALRTADRVDVAITLTTRACPLGTMIVRDARSCLQARFTGQADVDVELVWEPVWKPDRITSQGRIMLGR